MARDVTLIKGDGIGPEIVDSAIRCVDALGVEINWDVQPAGEGALKEYGSVLPETTLESIRKNKVALKGPVTTPIGKGFRSVNVLLRQRLNLFACVRPCRTYEGVQSKYEKIDLVVIRENTEDLYAGIEFEKDKSETGELIDFIEKKTGKIIPADSGISIKPISVTATRRIVEFAFDYARKNSRRKVTAVHKANIMKFSDGLFLETAREVAKINADIEFSEAIVDNMSMQLVQRPYEYDVLVLPNMYGDIISDLCAGLVGGLGVAPGANIGADIALFEPTHGSAPKYKGQNKVNPSAILLSLCLLLKYIGERKASEILESSVAKVIKDGKYVTYDMKPERNDPSAVGTKEMSDAIIDEIKAEK